MTAWFHRLSFEAKLNLGITTIITIMALALLPFVLGITREALVEEHHKRGMEMANALATRAIDPLLALDFLRLRDLAAESHQAAYIFIQDRAGRVLVHSFGPDFPVDLANANTATPTQPLRSQLIDTGIERLDDIAALVQVSGEPLGMVRVGLSRTAVSQTLDRLISTLIIIFLTALTLASAAGTLFARTITARLALLQNRAEALRHRHPAPSGSSQAPPPKTTNDEIASLERTFTIMAQELDARMEELLQAQRRLEEQTRLLTTVLDANPDRICLRDTRMIYHAANEAFCRAINRSKEEIPGSTDFDLFPEEEAERRHLEGRDVLMSGERMERQEQETTPQGNRWYHVVQVPVRSARGRIMGLLRMDRDITAIKEYERQLIQAQKIESLGKLAGGVAHEINTPLSIILGLTQLLLDDAEPSSPLAEDLHTIERHTQTCRKIVADLLEFSHASTSEKVEMCFNNSVMEAITLVRHTFSLDGVRIVTDLDDRFPIIYGDPEELKQVWVNLLTNARDALPQGGTIAVRTQLLTQEGCVRLEVADTGIGIDAPSVGKIFDPFFTTKPVGKGTGLGLSVSYSIIEKHKGSIQVQSPVPPHFPWPVPVDEARRGPGALFTVTIPLDHATLEENHGPHPRP
jgi:two-component system NtrC family sensor kinase